MTLSLVRHAGNYIKLRDQRHCSILSCLVLSLTKRNVWQFQACPKADWSKKYSEQQQVQARILYVDPTSKRIMLSLQPDLTSMTTRSLPSIGEVFEVSLPNCNVSVQLP